ncbi:MAG TPA: glycosyltransferase family 39 protein, partial [Thermoanaerobaculia bacterium]|nr:glycosyltransferase family 39 protein [Thermoanaerobaculia bacterium]
MSADAAGSDAWRRRAFAAAGALVAAGVVVTRFLARQKTFWEWDDFLFGRALHRFAPLEGLPQAPFYPGFILVGRLARAIVPDDVAALTLVSAISSCLAVLAVFGIAREIAGSTRTALAAAVLFAFFPAVWFHAGSPLSDDAGLAAALGALWASLVARRRPTILFGAIVLFAAAVSIRPQDAVIAVPALVLALRRRGALAATSAVVLPALAYGVPVVWASRGVGNAVRLFGRQAAYVVSTDSVGGRTRSLGAALGEYSGIWVRPKVALAVGLLAVAGIAVLFGSGRRRGLALLAASFVPYGAAALLLLDPAVGGRYVLPFLPAVAILCAAAATAIEQRFLFGIPLVAAAVVAAGVKLTAPAVGVLHTRPSPPVAAAESIRARVRGRFAVVYPVELHSHVESLFPDVPGFPAEETTAAALSASAVPVWRYGVSSFETETAVWPALSPFWVVGRGRYLSVAFGPWTPLPAFGRGWYPEEADGTERFRWMGRDGEIVLPPCAPPARLFFSLIAPIPGLGGYPLVEA